MVDTKPLTLHSFLVVSSSRKKEKRLDIEEKEPTKTSVEVKVWKTPTPLTLQSFLFITTSRKWRRGSTSSKNNKHYELKVWKTPTP